MHSEPMSAASAPISIASATSAIRSPADGPTMPQPITRSVAWSKSSLVSPSTAAQRQANVRWRPTGSCLCRTRRPRALRFVLGHPDPGHLGIGVGDRRNDPRVEVALLTTATSAATLAFVRRLVRQHRLPDDVSDSEDVRHVRPLLLCPRWMKPRLSTITPRPVSPDHCAVRVGGPRQRESGRTCQFPAPSARRSGR